MISMIPCLVHRAHVFCVFKCQICKSGGERICTVLSCCNLFSFSTVSAMIIPVHIQWQNSHSRHLVRISSTPVSLRGLLEGKKSYWTSLSLTKSLQNRYSLAREHNFKAVPSPHRYLDSRDRLAVTATDEKSRRLSFASEGNEV